MQHLPSLTELDQLARFRALQRTHRLSVTGGGDLTWEPGRQSWMRTRWHQACRRPLRSATNVAGGGGDTSPAGLAFYAGTRDPHR